MRDGARLYDSSLSSTGATHGLPSARHLMSSSCPPSPLSAAVVARTPRTTVSDLSANQILAKAEKALAAADSVTIEGKGKDDETEIEIDMGFAGDTASGSIAVDAVEFELLGAAGKAYFKATDDFYRENAGEGADELLALIDDRWVLADPGNPDFKDLASFVSRGDFFDELLDPEGEVTKGDEKTIDGSRVHRAQGRLRWRLLLRQGRRPAHQPGERRRRRRNPDVLVRRARRGRGAGCRRGLRPGQRRLTPWRGDWSSPASRPVRSRGLVAELTVREWNPVSGALLDQF